MKTLLFNLILALTWTAIQGEFTLVNLLIGFGVGYLILLFTQAPEQRPKYFYKFPKVIVLILFFLWDLVMSSLRVAYEVLTPTMRMTPAIVGIPLQAKTPLEITLLANLITLTPGTLSLDVSTDRKTLYIHTMYLKDVGTLQREIQDGFERRILEVTR